MQKSFLLSTIKIYHESISPAKLLNIIFSKNYMLE